MLGEVQLGHGDKQHLLQQVVQPHALLDLDHLKGGGDGGVWDVAIICLIFGEQTILSIFEHLSFFQIIRTKNEKVSGMVSLEMTLIDHRDQR